MTARWAVAASRSLRGEGGFSAVVSADAGASGASFMRVASVSGVFFVVVVVVVFEVAASRR